MSRYRDVCVCVCVVYVSHRVNVWADIKFTGISYCITHQNPLTVAREITSIPCGCVGVPIQPAGLTSEYIGGASV